MKFLLVLLAVFKYILLFLLILLLLVIIFAFVFLISPIRYSVTVNYKETDVYLNVNVTYLGKIVGFNFKKNNKKTQMFVRLFRKKINLSPDKPKTDGGQQNKKNSKTQKTNVSTKVAQKVTPTSTLEENTNLDETVQVTENISSDTSENNVNDAQNEFDELNFDKSNAEEINSETNQETEPRSDLNDTTKERTSFAEKFNSFLDKVYFYIHSYQTYPYRDKLFTKFKKIFHNLFDALIPKTFDISGKFYIKDPALTGQTLGYLYALYGVSSRFNISLDADFETEKTDVTALISGRIIIFKLVQPVISFVWLGLKAEAKRRKITRFKLIKILIKHE